MYGAALTDSEDYIEFDWLKEHIEMNFGFMKNRYARGTANFVDLHRYVRHKWLESGHSIEITSVVLCEFANLVDS